MSFNIYIAEDGEKALDLWEKHLPDLILMDVQIPILNGLEVTQIIREKKIYLSLKLSLFLLVPLLTMLKKLLVKVVMIL